MPIVKNPDVGVCHGRVFHTLGEPCEECERVIKWFDENKDKIIRQVFDQRYDGSDKDEELTRSINDTLIDKDSII